MPNRTVIKSIICGALATAALPAAVNAAVPAAPAATSLITAPLNAAHGQSLDYDAPLVMHVVSDAGALASGTALEHLQLVLNRPAERQAALDALVKQQLDPASPNFHKWVEPAEFGPAFGPSQSDVQQVVAWLRAEGFVVGQVSPNMMSIDFSGTAGHVARTFRTELHDVVNVAGEHHMANMSAPVIPAALGGVVHGVTLSNFFPKPALKPVGAVRKNGPDGTWSVTAPAPEFTVPAGARTYYAVTPSDFATIYNLNPARNGSSPNLFNPATGASHYKLTGAGVTLIVAEQTNINPDDWNTFRSGFGLSGFAGTLQSVHPGGCADPGFTPDEGEAALDAEWSSAVAPDATIIEASCAGTATTFGVMTTLQGLVNAGPRGSVITISYGGCEVGNGLSFLAMWSQLVEQAAAEGISVFVSTGDSAAAGCDSPSAKAATGGLAVNGLASNAYVTAIGGTDFSDTADGKNSIYWTASNSSSDGSAKSYIPEIPWDDSCASSVIWKAAGATGAIPYCNIPKQSLLNLVGGSGGKSLYYSKPDWQSTGVLGVPNDHVRGLPDVSLFASNGIWNHFYVFCMSDTNQGGTACDFTNVNDVLGNAAGGTSFSAPIFGGIEALVVQYKGGNVGLAAPRLYQLAQLQFGNPTLLSTCKSNEGASISVACVFNEITRGDNALPCVAGSPNCFTDAASTAGIGVLSTTPRKLTAAYPETLGWNFVSGLGSVNVTNLLINY